MIEKSLNSKVKISRTKEVNIAYKMIFKNAFYSFECKKLECSQKDSNTYCFAENITDDEGEAEAFLYRMSKGNVFPVHIPDMVEDYFLS